MEYLPHPERQSSREPWIIEFPEHWEERKLKFAVNMISSKVESKEHDGVQFMGLEHIESWTGKKIDGGQTASEGVGSLFEEDDILFGKLRPYLAKVYKAEAAGIATTEALVLRRESFADADFIKYYLLNPSFIDVVDGSTYGSKMPRANWGFIGNLRILLPPLQEQQKIATFLDHKTQQIDQLIEKKKALIDKLEEQRITVITQAVTKGLDKDVKLVPSGVDWLGDIPEGWIVRPLKYFVTFIDGDRSSDYPSGSDIVNEGIPFLSSKNIVKSKLDFTGLQFITEEKYISLGRGKLKRNDILITVRGSIGNVAVYSPEEYETGFINAQMTIARPEEMVDPYFIYLVMNSHVWKEQIDYFAYGTAQQQLSNNVLEQIKIAIPRISQETKNIVRATNAQLDGMDSISSVAQETLSKLQEYRSALITAAVTGKIDVRDWQAPTEIKQVAEIC